MIIIQKHQKVRAILQRCNNCAIFDFPANDNNSASFKLKTEIVERIGNDGAKDVKTMAPLKYLSKFWRTLEVPLVNYEINLILTCSANCFVIDAPINNQVPAFSITHTKFYVPVVRSQLVFSAFERSQLVK